MEPASSSSGGGLTRRSIHADDDEEDDDDDLAALASTPALASSRHAEAPRRSSRTTLALVAAAVVALLLGLTTLDSSAHVIGAALARAGYHASAALSGALGDLDGAMLAWNPEDGTDVEALTVQRGFVDTFAPVVPYGELPPVARGFTFLVVSHDGRVEPDLAHTLESLGMRVTSVSADGDDRVKGALAQAVTATAGGDGPLGGGPGAVTTLSWAGLTALQGAMHAAWAGSPQLAGADVLVCALQPWVLCGALAAFNPASRPLVLVGPFRGSAAMRVPAGEAPRWRQLVEQLARHPDVQALAPSFYDAFYWHHYTGSRRVLPVPSIGDFAAEAADGRARPTVPGAPVAFTCPLQEWAPPAADGATRPVLVEGCAAGPAAGDAPGCMRVFAQLSSEAAAAGVALEHAPGEAALRAALAGGGTEQLAKLACDVRGQSAVVLTGASMHPALAALAVALEVPLFAPAPALLAAWQANASTRVSAELAVAALPELPSELAMLLPPDGVPRAVTAGTCPHHPANARWSAAWAGYGDGAYIKGAIPYSSVADLAAKLRAVDLAGAHRKLQRHRRANRRLTHRSWEAAFRGLLSRRAPGVPPPLPSTPEAGFSAFQAGGAKPVFAAAPRAVPDDGARRGDKWIVITTINEPTEQVKTLASTDSGWRVTVVGDLASPPDWAWDNCEYLGPDTQRSSLGFGVVPLLPWNAYTRKNIGYLYAIAHGARTIYDTDDDNVILGGDPFTLPECLPPAAAGGGHGVGVTAPGSHRVINPHVYWGDEHLHPRGFPLEDVKHPGARHYEVVSVPGAVRVGVLQGLVNGDPDVDAVQRLTKRVKGTSFAPDSGREALVVGAGTLVPFNSQNTVFHYSAFWALMLPSTTTFRVCDIWRGYWTARLLWDVGARLGFLRATAVQDRNAHSLLKDFVDEVDLYINAGALVDFLLAWRGAEGDTLPQRYDTLMWELVSKGFIERPDAEQARAWLQDLANVGYEFPDVVPLPSIDDDAAAPAQWGEASCAVA